jgi:MFS family permease
VVLLSLPAVLSIPEPKRPQARDPAAGGSIKALLQIKMMPIWLVTCVFAGLVAVFMSFVTVAAGRQGIAHPATLWIFYAGAAVTVRLFGARIPEWLGLNNVVAPAVAAYTCAMITAATATTGTGFMVAGALAGLGHGYCFPVLTSQVVNRTPDVFRGAGLAAFTAIWDFASLILPPIFGGFADQYGDSAMFSGAAVLAVIGLLLWLGAEASVVRRRS